MTLLFLAVVAAVAFAAAVAVVPLITRVAVARSLLDYPDGARRSHSTAVPRLGGIAVFVGLLAALLASVLTSRITHVSVDGLPNHSLALIGACAILFTIGLLDDLQGVRPLFKLLGQTLAAVIVCHDGFLIDRLALPPHYVISLGWLALPLTVVWLVGVSNAFNLVDGLDGLAGGVAIIMLGAIGAAAAVLGNMSVPFYAVALGGALLGFLRFNVPPARIFLGDSGSLVVGFLLAFLAVKGATRPDGTLLTIVPIFALSYPLLDTGIAMLRRWLRGDPLSRADGRHIHHQLRALGLSSRKALGVIYLEATTVAWLGLLVTFAPPSVTVMIAAAGAAILLFILVYGVRWLQYHEFLEAGTVLASSGSRMRDAIRDTINARDISRVVCTAGTFENLNAVLEDASDLFRFAHMQVGPTVRGAPAHVLIAGPVANAWKVEYPIVTSEGDSIEDEEGRPVFLTIWCATAARVRAASVERVAEIIAPAIAAWAANGGAVLLRRTAPRRVYSPAVGQRAIVSGRIPPELTITGSFARENQPLH